MAYDTVRTKMGDLGITRPIPSRPKVEFMESAKEVGNLLDRITSIPKIKIDPLPQLKEIGREQEQVLLFSDSQVGQQTPQFNSKVFLEEMKTLQDRVQKLCLLQRRIAPVKRLSVFFLGDIIENERVGYQVSLEELEKVVLDQIFEISTPSISNMLVNFLQVYEQIDCFCVRGNHGNIGKFAATTTNWDTIVYKILELRLKEFDRIKWHIEDKHFYQVAQVMDWKYLLIHGDLIPSWMGIPHYGLERRMSRLKINLPVDFHMVCLGHFHSTNLFRYGGIPTILNGTFSFGSDYPLQKLGLADTPTQWSFFVHEDRPIVAPYEIELRPGMWRSKLIRPNG